MKKKNIVNDIIDSAMDMYVGGPNREFRLWVTPKVYKKIEKVIRAYVQTDYRVSGVTKNNGDTEYGIKTFTIMGLIFYVSIDDTIKDFKLIKIHGEI